MIKRSLLAASVAAISAQSALAAPFLPIDARGLAMGNTGVASAQRAHAPAYNPSLLSQAHEDDDFALIFPQLGVSVRDEEDTVSTAEDIADDLLPALEDLIEDGVDGGPSFELRVEALEQAINNFDVAIQNINNNSITPSTRLSNLETRNTELKDALEDVRDSLSDVDNVADNLTESLESISGDPLSGRLGVGTALAIPSKKFAAALSVSGTATFSGRAIFSDRDLDLLGSYVPGAQAYIDEARAVTNTFDAALTAANAETNDADKVQTLANELQTNNIEDQIDDASNFGFTAGNGTEIFSGGELTDEASDPNLDSRVEVVAVAVVEAALSFSREFTIAGEQVAIGITPKIQKISTFHYVTEVDNDDDIESEDIEDSQEDYSHFNLDIGASYRFGDANQWTVGLVAKNLNGGEFDYQDAVVEVDAEDRALPNFQERTIRGGKVSLDPQFRAGLAYQTEWVALALDVDLMENDPVAFENPTQYAALGAELNLWDTVQFRTGYRTNMSASDADVVSVGFGFSPFGVHLDIAALANPNDVEKEAGVAMELGFYF
ncbi:conjugal transfer protein TraF [Bacterioplanoides sp.]|uniref:conjugal transfer protein TraF n=1 Tax=Bacterioplanoides sp. TaxID=2066072 RepID=UPI003B006E54